MTPPRDLTPPPERTSEDLDQLAEITEEDLRHAQETASRHATAAMKRILNATKDERADRTPPKTS